MQANEVARCLEALGNSTRLEIYRLLVRAGFELTTIFLEIWNFKHELDLQAY